MAIGIGRRQFMSALGGAAVGWPHLARAQEGERERRIGVLMGYAEDDPEAQRRIASFRHGLSEAGWVPGRNLQIDYRWANADVERIKQFAKELVALNPDVILANTTPVTAALKRETSTIPIVFVIVSDPVGAGFTASLARPGGNITGFINFEDTMGGKWLELLKEVAPGITHAAIMFNPETAPGGGGYFLPSFEAAGPKLGVRTSTALVHSPADIERTITDLAAEPHGALVMMSDSFLMVHRKEVMTLTETYKLPSSLPIDAYAKEGGLLSYAPDYPDLFGRSASYVARILKGEKPADLPVQVPTKYELAVNLKTAKALGLTIPQSFLLLVDEVIE
jgi:putative ABC transport system substrate-binding protein